MLTAIDHMIIAVRDLAEAAAPFEKLGLQLTPVTRHTTGNANRALFVGSENSEFYIELLAVYDAARASGTAGWAAQEAALNDGPRAFRLMLASEDLAGLAAHLTAAGVANATELVSREDGSKVCDVLRCEAAARAGCEVAFISYPESASARRQRHERAGLFGHDLPLQRLDHLALIAPQLEEVTAFWRDVLGVPVYGEVRGRGMVIRQMKIGDAILELIGPDSPESPLASRPSGLISMAAFQVEDADAVVGTARERGFTAPDSALGVLPESRVSTISGDQLSGLSLQLIEYPRPVLW